MKFQYAILSIATATLSGVNNNAVVDAKIWNLRGVGNADNNNNELVNSESIPLKGEELPSPTANRRELPSDEQQGERKLPKKKKNKGGGKRNKGGGEEEGGGSAKKKGGKGQKNEKIGEAIYTEAPEDVVAKVGCDEIIDEEDQDDRARLRRYLAKNDKKKTKGTKAKKEDLRTGACESFSTNEEPTQEDVDASGVDVPVEAAEFPTCDPDADGPCEDDEFLNDDPTLTPPEDEEGEGAGAGAEYEATSRELMARELIEGRRLTGNTNQIGDFAPLSCNPVEFDCTGAAGLSSVLGDESTPVTVPCGTCLVVSK